MLVRRLAFGAFSGPIRVDHVDQLARMFPDDPVRIRGVDGFRPISNASHWAAAGYGPLPVDPKFDPDAPAHFNVPFFEFVPEETCAK